VVTPTIGFFWMVGEDAADRYLIKAVEARSTNAFWRITARTALNPARSFANIMAWKVPWYRDSRPGVYEYVATRELKAALAPEPPVRPFAPFEFSVTTGVRQVNGDPCMGGGAEGALRFAAEWQLVMTVNGCKKLDQPKYVSGDALVYQIGPRWTPLPGGKWSPFAQLLVGGIKLTQETLDPVQKVLVTEANKNLDPMLAYTLHGQYTKQEDTNALALSAGMGVDYKLNPALAIRVASLEYLHSRNGPLGAGGFQMTTGMVLRWGTW